MGEVINPEAWADWVRQGQSEVKPTPPGGIPQQRSVRGEVPPAGLDMFPSDGSMGVEVDWRTVEHARDVLGRAASQPSFDHTERP